MGKNSLCNLPLLKMKITSTVIIFLSTQIHRLTKDKCRLEEQVSGREADLTMARDSTQALKEDLAIKTEHITHLENELCMLKVNCATPYTSNFL